MGLFDEIKKFLMGSPEKHERVSTLGDNQQQILTQLLQAISGQGAGGAFGDAADFYRMILGDDPRAMEAFEKPEMRRFNEQIIPGLSEQFAGMGSGGLSSSGFRNAAVNAGTDLSERLGALRAQMKQQAAQGMMGLGGAGLGNFTQDVMTQKGTQGFLPSVSEGFGKGVGGLAGDFLKSKFGL